MPLRGYGLLKGKAIGSQNGGGENHHFHVLVVDDELRHRVAVNVTSSIPPSDLLYFVDEDFNHPIIEELIALPFGFLDL
ncbi:MAG: DUF2278 family protein, partial [Methanothrix sp.]|nr:DUF2278 family protein [Methanothrix sp.]